MKKCEHILRERPNTIEIPLVRGQEVFDNIGLGAGVFDRVQIKT